MQPKKVHRKGKKTYFIPTAFMPNHAKVISGQRQQLQHYYYTPMVNIWMKLDCQTATASPGEHKRLQRIGLENFWKPGGTL